MYLHINFKKYIICAIFVLIHNCVFAQFGKIGGNRGNLNDENTVGNIRNNTSDTTKQDITRSNKNKIINLKIRATNFYGNVIFLDTAINNLHTKWNLPYFEQNLGNVNSAVYSLKFKMPMQATQLLGNTNYTSYNNNIDSILFYNTSNPYTQMRFNGGNKQENGIQILHTQNVNALTNFSFSYSKYGGPGFYNLQRTFRDNAHFAMQFRPHAKSRYSGQYAIVYNKNQQDENGGIANEDDLIDPIWVQRNTVPVNYTSSNLRATASATKNVYRQMQLHIKNMYALSFANTTQDSIMRTPNLQVFYGLKIHAEKQIFKDRDPNNLKYNLLTDSVFKNYDTIIAINKVNTISNEFGIKLPNVKKLHAGLEAVFGIEIQNHGYAKVTKNYFNNYVSALLTNTDTASKWDFSASAKLYLLGKAVGNYAIDARASRVIKNNIISMQFLQTLQDAPYIMQQYVANFYGWNNNLKKQFITQLGANMVLKKYKLQAGLQNYTILNYTYFTDSLIVQQALNPLVLLQANVQKDFTYKKWQLQTNAILQPTTNTAPVNLPTIIANINLGYTSYIFKRSLLANIGIQASYNNNFYTPGYSAFINNYTFSNAYLQKNLPQLGVFFNGKVKTFRYSLQVLEMQQTFNTNDFENTIGKNRMLLANYPAPNLQFKFGFSWVFLN